VQIEACGRLLLDPDGRRFVIAENQARFEIDAAARLAPMRCTRITLLPFAVNSPQP